MLRRLSGIFGIYGIYAILTIGLALAQPLPTPTNPPVTPVNVPVGFCALTSVASATNITTSNCVYATFTGAIAGNVLTASAVTGNLLAGQPIVGTGVPNGTYIVGGISGTGGAGTYRIQNNNFPAPFSLTIIAESMTTAGIPPRAYYAAICAYTQAINWRDDGVAPTAAVGTGGQAIPSGQCMPYNGDFTKIQFIQQSATGVLALTFYQ